MMQFVRFFMLWCICLSIMPWTLESGEGRGLTKDEADFEKDAQLYRILLGRLNEQEISEILSESALHPAAALAAVKFLERWTDIGRGQSLIASVLLEVEKDARKGQIQWQRVRAAGVMGLMILELRRTPEYLLEKRIIEAGVCLEAEVRALGANEVGLSNLQRIRELKISEVSLIPSSDLSCLCGILDESIAGIFTRKWQSFDAVQLERKLIEHSTDHRHIPLERIISALCTLGRSSTVSKALECIEKFLNGKMSEFVVFVGAAKDTRELDAIEGRMIEVRNLELLVVRVKNGIGGSPDLDAILKKIPWFPDKLKMKLLADCSKQDSQKSTSNPDAPAGKK